MSTGRALNTKPPEKLRGTAPAVPKKSQINKSGAQLHPHRSSSHPSSLQRSAKEEQEKSGRDKRIYKTMTNDRRSDLTHNRMDR